MATHMGRSAAPLAVLRVLLLIVASILQAGAVTPSFTDTRKAYKAAADTISEEWKPTLDAVCASAGVHGFVKKLAGPRTMSSLSMRSTSYRVRGLPIYEQNRVCSH